MTITVTCQCGKKYAARPELAGQRLRCPSCGAEIEVPQDAAAEVEPQTVIAECSCGKRFKAPAKLLGREVRCPSCGSQFVVGQTATASAPAANSMDDLFNDPFAELPPPLAPRAPPPYVTKKKPKSQPVNYKPLLIIGGGLAALLAVIGLSIYGFQVAKAEWQKAKDRSSTAQTTAASSTSSSAGARSSDGRPPPTGMDEGKAMMARQQFYYSVGLSATYDGPDAEEAARRALSEFGWIDFDTNFTVKFDDQQKHYDIGFRSKLKQEMPFDAQNKIFRKLSSAGFHPEGFVMSRQVLK